MDVDDGGFPRLSAGGLEQLSVRFHTIAGAEGNQFGCNELGRRKIGRRAIAANCARASARYRKDCRGRRPLRIGSQERDGLTIGRDDRAPLDACSARQRRWCRRIDGHLEKMPPIHVAAIRAGVRIVDDEAAIGRQRHLLQHKRPGRQRHWLTAGAGMLDRIKMWEPISIGHKQKAIVGCPA